MGAGSCICGSSLHVEVGCGDRTRQRNRQADLRRIDLDLKGFTKILLGRGHSELVRKLPWTFINQLQRSRPRPRRQIPVGPGGYSELFLDEVLADLAARMVRPGAAIVELEVCLPVAQRLALISFALVSQDRPRSPACRAPRRGQTGEGESGLFPG